MRWKENKHFSTTFHWALLVKWNECPLMRKLLPHREFVLATLSGYGFRQTQNHEKSECVFFQVVVFAYLRFLEMRVKVVPCPLSFLFHNLVGAAMKSVFQKSLLEVLNPIHSLLCHSNVPNEWGGQWGEMQTMINQTEFYLLFCFIFTNRLWLVSLC